MSYHTSLVLFLVSLVQIERAQLQRVTKIQPPTGKQQQQQQQRDPREIKWCWPSDA